MQTKTDYDPKPYMKNLIKALKAELQIDIFVQALKTSWKTGGRVYIMGNGGSGAIASHFAQDLRKNIRGFTTDGFGIKAYALTDNIPFLTATANDNGYEKIFSDYLDSERLNSLDTVIAISCSGNSNNVLKAVVHAKRYTPMVYGLTGNKDGTLRKLLGAGKCVVLEHPDIRGQEDLIGIFLHVVIASLDR